MEADRQTSAPSDVYRNRRFRTSASSFALDRIPAEMKNPIRALCLAGALALASAVPARAQLYGMVPAEDHASDRDLYRARIRQEVTVLMGSLKRAWDAKNAGAAVGLYARDGVLVGEDGQEVSARDELRAAMERIFASRTLSSYAVRDFDTSFDLAFMRGEMSSAMADGSQRIQPFILVAHRQRGDAWQIRSLLLLPQPR